MMSNIQSPQQPTTTTTTAPPPLVPPAFVGAAPVGKEYASAGDVASSGDPSGSASPTCARASDNYWRNCPPMMSDGRHFTDYRPQCTVNSQLNVDNGIVLGIDQRMLLTRNATQFMGEIRGYVTRRNACTACTGGPGGPAVDHTPSNCPLTAPFVTNNVCTGDNSGVAAVIAAASN